MVRGLAIVCFLLWLTPGIANDSAPAQVTPKKVGERNIVADFSVDAAGKPQFSAIVSSEATNLNAWAKALIQMGRVKADSPGVRQISAGKYRTTISFPLAGDAPPLPDYYTLPVVKLQPPPEYPYELCKSGTSGAALFKLTFDESGKIKNIELVRGTHSALVDAAKQAMRRWRYSQPAKKAGVPVEVTLNQLFIFLAEGARLPSWELLISPEPALPEITVTGAIIPAR